MNVSESKRSCDPDRPLVSIVVNNYNNERYLSSCLDGLLAQTYLNIEIVVVDAFSSDCSRQIIDDYAQRDSRIKRVYCNSYEKYPAITYNLGFLNCQGNYIAINDPDDISMPQRMEDQIKFLLNNHEVDVVGCNCYEFNDDYNELVETTVEKNILSAASPARNPSLMFRKEVMAKHGLWRWQCEYAADFEWLYRWYTGGVRFHILPQAHLRFRKAYGTNISTTKTVNQSIKLALFGTWYGMRLFNKVGFKWWLVTAKNGVYACVRLLLPNRLFNKYLKKKR